MSLAFFEKANLKNFKDSTRKYKSFEMTFQVLMKF